MTGVYKLPEYTQHPVAIALMPGGMDEPEFEAFCLDIEQRGIIYPITIFEDQVLDGWHRYRAAKKTGCSIKVIEYSGKDPAGYIAACNVLRRKLSSLQRALVGAKLHREHGVTQRDACKRLGISNEVITLVLKAMDSGITKIVKHIETNGDFSRSMLKEELEDAGVYRTNKTSSDAPKGPNSVFDLAANKSFISDAAATNGIKHLLDEQEDVPEDFGMPDAGKKPSHKERKSKVTAAQTLSDGFKALMADEKITFLQMIWPEAGPLMDKHKIDTAIKMSPAKKVAAKKTLQHKSKNVLMPIDALVNAVKH